MVLEPLDCLVLKVCKEVLVHLEFLVVLVPQVLPAQLVQLGQLEHQVLLVLLVLLDRQVLPELKE